MARIAYTAKEVRAIDEAWTKVINFMDNRDITMRIRATRLVALEIKNSGRSYSRNEARMYVIREIAYGIEKARAETTLADLCGIMETRVLAMVLGADMTRRFISTAREQLAELSSLIRYAEIGHEAAFQRFLVRARAA